MPRIVGVKTALGIITAINYKDNNHSIFEQLLPAVRMIFKGLMARKKINNSQLQKEIYSDVVYHLWSIISRNKINFAVKPQQLAAFLMRDITYTVGGHFQRNRIFNYEELSELEYESSKDSYSRKNIMYEDLKGLSVMAYENERDINLLAEDMALEHADWCLRYSELLGRDIARPLKRAILRRVQYETTMEYIRQ